ncbi:hypothetical protein [Cyclobacterium roseum]|uniref:hypothetical protein n=1 Tax=Cyclobacterium roseum TaxID=2666137 RepID=UPI001391FD5D|nr:hypothetical protein [Cyclobacterium roseum]
MSNKNDFIEGMGSVFDIGGDRHFNEFKEYPSRNGVIRNTWNNLGCHIDNAANKLAKETGLSSNSTRRKLRFGKK